MTAARGLMNEQKRSVRIKERLELRLPVRVHCRETPDFAWSEVTRMIDVTPFGAGFTIKRPTERGRLLHMTIPMPRQLRIFDYVEDQYKVWGVVRYVRPPGSARIDRPASRLASPLSARSRQQVIEKDPTTRYEVTSELGESGMLGIKEPAANAAPAPTSERLHTRHNIPVALSLETFTEAGEVADVESTVTENISRGGATIFTGLDIPIGRFVRLSSPEYNLTVHAVVRGRSHGTAGMPRMHLEFIDREWPVEWLSAWLLVTFAVSARLMSERRQL